MSARPRAVAVIRNRRLSLGSPSRVTNPSSSSASTNRVMVGGRTCSAAASSRSVSGPEDTITDKADRRGAVIPVVSSFRRSRRNR